MKYKQEHHDWDRFENTHVNNIKTQHKRNNYKNDYNLNKLTEMKYLL